MATVKHTKHAALVKPLGGEFHRNEWAIIGAPCSVIHRLAAAINTHLKPQMKIGYLDAAHNTPDLPHAYHTGFTDKIAYQEFTTLTKPAQKQHRKFFNELDLLLVNGNHFKGDKQIVLINEKKRDSLKRKLNRLTDVRLILLEKESDSIYDFLADILPSDRQIPILNLEKIEKICDLIAADFQRSIPPLFGLVLAGGKSVRMGRDKGGLEYYNKPHRAYLADLLQPYCHEVFVSFKDETAAAITSAYPKLYDTFTGLGPYGAILSAFREHPNHAWLTVACDLPYLNADTIEQLVESRNPSKLATCFHNPATNFPEPLITIWEPRAYPVLLAFLSQGYSCPKKVLINTSVKEIEMHDPTRLFNANDPSAYKEAKRQIENWASLQTTD